MAVEDKNGSKRLSKGWVLVGVYALLAVLLFGMVRGWTDSVLGTGVGVRGVLLGMWVVFEGGFHWWAWDSKD